METIQVNSVADIPEFLEKSISIIYDLVLLTRDDGTEICSLGSLVGYEKSEKTSTGWNCWCVIKGPAIATAK